MPRLPPLPTDVLEFRPTIATEGTDVELVQHVHAPASVGWDPAHFGQWITGWATSCEQKLLDLLPGGSSFTTCRLSRFGPVPFSYVTVVAANNGAGGSAQSLNSALCLTWRTEAVGFQARAHNRLPLQGQVVATGLQRIDDVFWSFARERTDEYLLAVNAIVVSGFTSPQLVVVSRRAQGAPRATAAFSPVVAGDVCRHVATLQSRTRVRR